MIVVFFLIFLVAGIYDFFAGHFADSGILLGVTAMLGFFMYFVAKQAREAREFLDWLKLNRAQIEQGWAYYKSQKVKPKSLVSRYQGCASFGIFTTRFRSRYVIDGRGAAEVNLAFSALSFLLGWWGLPWGFIFTPQALYRNLRGGHKKFVSDILPNVDAEIDSLSSGQRLSKIFALARAEARG
jgi:hypothetical protein